MSRVAYLDVGPLFESHWTGIPEVNAGIAERSLVDREVEWRYMFQNIDVERAVVDGLVRARSGTAFTLHVEEQALAGKFVDPRSAASADALFLNVKELRGTFEREALVVHDLSTLLTPEFHHQNTIDHHANRMRIDIETSDFFFCVSRATGDDLMAYFGVSENKIAVLPLGIRFDPCDVSALAQGRYRSREPYVLVLSTIEPRKNGAIIFDYIAAAPSFLERYKVVFAGRTGWLDAKERLLSQVDSAGLDRNRIIFTGFIDERRKAQLVYHAAFCIYPSFFEGFGLPILEAAALGKFVVSSNSSSMVEVAPDRSFFFDPLDVSSLARAIEGAEIAVSTSLVERSSFPDLWARVNARSFDRGYNVIRNWILGRAA